MKKFPAQPSTDSEYEKGLAETVYKALGLKDPLTKRFVVVLFQMAKVFDYKQGKYGEDNIRQIGDDGVNGRLQDKVSRIKHMLARGQQDEDEPIEDSFGDAGNYGAIGLMRRWGWWPGVAAWWEREKMDNSSGL